MEYCGGGEISDYLKTLGRLEEDEVYSIAN
jgi:hypothetical protein